MSHSQEQAITLSNLDAIFFDFDAVLNRDYDSDGFVWARALKADHGLDIAEFRTALGF